MYGGGETAKEEGSSRLGRLARDVLRSALVQRSHPVISLGCGHGVLPLVIYHPLKC